MGKYRFVVSEDCIGCKACIEIAGGNFALNEAGKAYVKKQPEDSEEEGLCREALDVCPVGAISANEGALQAEVKPILAKSNIKETLDAYPELKPLLVKLSARFKRLQNPVAYNTLARFATFEDASRITGVSICEILHTINKHLGVEKKLLKSMPDCIETIRSKEECKGVDVYWQEKADRYIYNEETMTDLVQRVSRLGPHESIVVISVEEPIELLKVAAGLGYDFNIERGKEFRVSIYNPHEAVEESWKDRKSDFELLDMRDSKSPPFDIIMEKAQKVGDGSGFAVIQAFEPVPLINMLSQMGFESLTEKKGSGEVVVYFYKKPQEEREAASTAGKPDVVIQSATPVAFPVVMRLLDRGKIEKTMNIKELKIWVETERHLGWIVSGKADISFSSLLTSARLKDRDVKIPAIFVWDNFVLLTRYEAKRLEDVRGREIHIPLFEQAPPAKITKYLIEASGLEADDFEFVFGEPFGRPEKIFADFVAGRADTVLLREPEASYALKVMKDLGRDVWEIPFNEIWNEVNEGFGSFPNACLVLKGEFVRKNPEIVRNFLGELKGAIEWINENKKEAARLSFEAMGQPVDRVELFCNRVNFRYVEGEELIAKVKSYFGILSEHGIIDGSMDERFFDMFRLWKE
ncbi:MAG: hypothetical protein B6D63_00755 [Candidatus Latescibacteria bacterium 4484_7]|nr:MAG: hypothetical protein B6D63_00755 [Candidatus Latescibacteria bacterium 4484_7]